MWLLTGNIYVGFCVFREPVRFLRGRKKINGGYWDNSSTRGKSAPYKVTLKILSAATFRILRVGKRYKVWLLTGNIYVGFCVL